MLQTLADSKVTLMLLTIAIILLVLWGLGLVTHVVGGLIHIILVVALVMLVLHFVRGTPKV